MPCFSIAKIAASQTLGLHILDILGRFVEDPVNVYSMLLSMYLFVELSKDWLMYVDFTKHCLNYNCLKVDMCRYFAENK